MTGDIAGTKLVLCCRYIGDGGMGGGVGSGGHPCVEIVVPGVDGCTVDPWLGS